MWRRSLYKLALPFARVCQIRNIVTQTHNTRDVVVCSLTVVLSYVTRAPLHTNQPLRSQRLLPLCVNTACGVSNRGASIGDGSNTGRETTQSQHALKTICFSTNEHDQLCLADPARTSASTAAFRWRLFRGLVVFHISQQSNNAAHARTHAHTRPTTHRGGARGGRARTEEVLLSSRT